jgi:antitoxin (DNA-binding transcriptional repressor) of toxin-antitoxin stability system
MNSESRKHMERYSLREAQTQLSQLIAEAQQGKTVLIVDDSNQTVQLIPVTSHPGKRKAGSARGQITIAPDFDAPLADFNEYMA